MTFVLDTHVLLWWIEGGQRHLSRPQSRVLKRVTAEQPLHVADVTLWEVATLVELGRVRLTLPLRDWLEQATAPPLVRRVEISPAVAAEVAALPATFHRDPADRLIVATTRVLGATLLTSDDRISRARLVPTIS